MKKLSNMKGKVHPSPVPTLSFLPPTILILAAALSPEDKEVLAYLILFCGSTGTNNNNNNNTTANSYKTTHKSTRSGGGGGGGGDGEHAPLFNCNCFRCYKSFWARWDMSPKRQLIHEIIEAYEEGLFRENNKRSLKKKKKKRGNKRVCDDDQFKDGESGSPDLTSSDTGAAAAEDLGKGDHGGKDDDEVEEEKGSVAKVVSFLGERIWNFWGKNQLD